MGADLIFFPPHSPASPAPVSSPRRGGDDPRVSEQANRDYGPSCACLYVSAYVLGVGGWGGLILHS